MRGQVLAAVPEELRAAARQLRQVAAESGELAERLGRAGSGRPGWAGLAELEQRSRTGSVQTLVAAVAGPGEEVALVLDRCALAAEEAGSRVRTAQRGLEEARQTEVRLHVGGPPPDPVGAGLWERRRAEVEAELARWRSAIEEAEADFDRTQRQAAAAVHDAWDRVSTAVGHAVTLVDLGRRLGGVSGKGLLAHLAAPGLLALVLARRRGGSAGLAAARREAARRLSARRLAEVRAKRETGLMNKAVSRAGEIPGMPKLPLGLLGPAMAGMAMLDGAMRAVDGGGYEGWRGGVTRVLGGAAVVAVPVSLLAAAPVVALAGTVTVAAYTTWMAGNWVYDNRVKIGRAAKATWRAGVDLQHRAIGGALRTGQRAGKAVERAGTRLGLRGLGELARLEKRGMKEAVRIGARLSTLADRVDNLAGEVLRRETQPILLPELPSLPRLPIQLPDLPRLRFDPLPLPRLRLDLPTLPTLPTLPRLRVELPSLPRLPVELPRPFGGLLPGGATS